MTPSQNSDAPRWQNPYGPTPYGNPPASQNPYGQNPYGQNPYGPPPQAPGPPVGPYGPPPPPRRRGQPDSAPGRFTWWDLGATLFYVLTFFFGGISLLTLIPEIGSMLSGGDPEAANWAGFLLNAVGYGVMGLICVLLSAAALWRAVLAFAYLWWLKLLLIPVVWLGIVATNAVLVSLITDTPEPSANQQAIEEMLGAVPMVGALLVLGLLGPYVEEFFFRHLLIGKLSRYLNIWICGAVSVIIFPLIHFVPALIGVSDDLSLAAVIPYVTMGLAFTLAYILSGRSLLYAWLLHAANNCVAVLLQYLVLPHLPELEELDLPGVVHPLLVMAGAS